MEDGRAVLGPSATAGADWVEEDILKGRLKFAWPVLLIALYTLSPLDELDELRLILRFRRLKDLSFFVVDGAGEEVWLDVWLEGWNG